MANTSKSSIRGGGRASSSSDDSVLSSIARICGSGRGGDHFRACRCLNYLLLNDCRCLCLLQRNKIRSTIILCLLRFMLLLLRPKPPTKSTKELNIGWIMCFWGWWWWALPLTHLPETMVKEIVGIEIIISRREVFILCCSTTTTD